jgi:hypothetical protein
VKNSLTTPFDINWLEASIKFDHSLILVVEPEDHLPGMEMTHRRALVPFRGGGYPNPWG